MGRSRLRKLGEAAGSTRDEPLFGDNGYVRNGYAGIQCRRHVMRKPGMAMPGTIKTDPSPARDDTHLGSSVTHRHMTYVDIGHMAHKYPNILIHLVFSTKERANLIPADLFPRLAKYFGGIGRNHGLPVLAAGGIFNHIHLLVALPSDMTPAKAVQLLKANSSRWIRQHGIAFAWQEAYGAFSVSSSNKAAVASYIENQADHHRVRSYESEFEAMVRKSGMPFEAAEAFG